MSFIVNYILNVKIIIQIVFEMKTKLRVNLSKRLIYTKANFIYFCHN